MLELLEAAGLSTVASLHFLANKPSLSFTYCPAGSTVSVSELELEREDDEHRSTLSKLSAIVMTSDILDEVFSSIRSK